MTTARRAQVSRGAWRVSAVLLPAVAALLSGCLEPDPTDPDVRDALEDVNREFGLAYQQLLREIGSHSYPLDAAPAMRGMERVLTEMGFRIMRREGDHFLHVAAPAPLPLDAGEWHRVRDVDEPRLRQIAIGHLGVIGNFAELEPEGLEIEGYVTVVPSASGVDIAITMRMLETKPPPPDSILPRREYPPPSAVRIGYEKIWRRFGTLMSAAGAGGAAN